jgi:CHASE2 domain-containing sensor protein
MSGKLSFRPLLNPVLTGALAAVAFTALWYVDAGRIADFVRERTIDSVQLAFPREDPRARVLVVDIDDRTLARRGGGPAAISPASPRS